MKTKIVFLWLFVLLATATMGQPIIVSSPGYSLDGTKTNIDVRTGTVITITATLPSGATSTYWTSSRTPVVVTTPSQLDFPVTVIGENQIVFTMPVSYPDIVITVLFNTGQTSWVKLIRNDNIASGLLSVQQNIQDCLGVVNSFNATTTLLSGFLYKWQEYSTPTWIDLGSNTNYSAVNHVLSVTTDVSIKDKRFRCIVTNPNCLGAIDITAEVVVQTVYALPNNQIPTVNVSVVSDIANVCGLTVPIVIGLTATQSGYIYELYDVNTGTVIDTVTSPPVPVDGPITFSVQVADRKFGIRAWTPTRSCSLIIHK